MWLETCGEKLLTLLVIRLIGYILDPVPRRLHELWKGRKPNVKYFRIFGSTCSILKDRENVGKLIPEAMNEYFWDNPLQARLIGYTTKEP